MFDPREEIITPDAVDTLCILYLAIAAHLYRNFSSSPNEKPLSREALRLERYGFCMQPRL
jgi:hypothetical protein